MSEDVFAIYLGDTQIASSALSKKATEIIGTRISLGCASQTFRKEKPPSHLIKGKGVHEKNLGEDAVDGAFCRDGEISSSMLSTQGVPRITRFCAGKGRRGDFVNI